MNATTTRISMNNWANEDKPSYKILNRGAETLTDTELISILVGSGTAQYNALEIANILLTRFDRDLSKLSKADVYDLKGIEGVGQHTIAKLMAAMELGKRRQLATHLPSPDLSSAVAVYNMMHPVMCDKTIEEFHILMLNQNYRLIKQERISYGGLTETSVDIRIILRDCILNNATRFVAVHNHPSGNPHPSQIDDQLTKNIENACKMMRIMLVDHIIIGADNYYSYKERGRL